MTHPDDLTGVDVFDVPDASLSPTDPAELVAWLRGLPVGTVLLDSDGDAWQVKYDGPLRTYKVACVTGGSAGLGDGRADMLAALAPYRLIWSSGGGR